MDPEWNSFITKLLHNDIKILQQLHVTKLKLLPVRGFTTAMHG